jgi:hypothetical protein
MRASNARILKMYLIMQKRTISSHRHRAALAPQGELPCTPEASFGHAN